MTSGYSDRVTASNSGGRTALPATLQDSQESLDPNYRSVLASIQIALIRIILKNNESAA